MAVRRIFGKYARAVQHITISTNHHITTSPPALHRTSQQGRAGITLPASLRQAGTSPHQHTPFVAQAHKVGQASPHQHINTSSFTDQLPLFTDFQPRATDLLFVVAA